MKIAPTPSRGGLARLKRAAGFAPGNDLRSRWRRQSGRLVAFTGEAGATAAPRRPA